MLSSENTSDADKIKELEAKLLEKDQDIETIKEKTSEAIKRIKNDSIKQIEDMAKKIDIPEGMKGKNSDDIAPGIRKTYTFEGGYRNAYETDEYKKKLKKAKEEQERKNKSKK